jgi:hypothetical protein
MSIFDNLHLAVRTRTIDDAGTSSGFNLTVNVDATDILDQNFSVDLDKGEATLLGGPFPETLDSDLLTNTSARLGIRGDDAWAPQDVLLFGLAFERNELAALAMETDLSDADLLSTDYREGKLSMPMRLVGRGSSSTLIRRVLLLVDTIWQSWTDTETDSPIELEITAGGNLVLLQEVIDTPQPDLEAGKSNWYPLDAAVPFTRAERARKWKHYIEDQRRRCLEADAAFSIRTGYRNRPSQRSGQFGLNTCLAPRLDEHGHKGRQAVGAAGRG